MVKSRHRLYVFFSHSSCDLTIQPQEYHRPFAGRITIIHNWLVLLTILKISQWEGLSHILWKIKNVPNHQPDNNSMNMAEIKRGMIPHI